MRLRGWYRGPVLPRRTFSTASGDVIGIGVLVPSEQANQKPDRRGSRPALASAGGVCCAGGTAAAQPRPLANPGNIHHRPRHRSAGDRSDEGRRLRFRREAAARRRPDRNPRASLHRNDAACEERLERATLQARAALPTPANVRYTSRRPRANPTRSSPAVSASAFALSRCIAPTLSRRCSPKAYRTLSAYG
jgi:hypothetical protein